MEACRSIVEATTKTIYPFLGEYNEINDTDDGDKDVEMTEVAKKSNDEHKKFDCLRYCYWLGPANVLIPAHVDCVPTICRTCYVSCDGSLWYKDEENDEDERKPEERGRTKKRARPTRATKEHFWSTLEEEEEYKKDFAVLGYDSPYYFFDYAKTLK
jgi:hypothetical protein